MSDALTDQATLTLSRLRDAARRGDMDDLARIANGLGLHEARALVGGMAIAAFVHEPDVKGDER